MQCNCGGATIAKDMRHVKKKVPVSVAELDVCEACGRVADGVRIYLVDENWNKTKFIRHIRSYEEINRHSKARPGR